MTDKNQFKDSLECGNDKFDYYSLSQAADYYQKDLAKLPYVIKLILENLLRHHEDDNEEQIKALFNWPNVDEGLEIAFYPSRVLMQDFTGVPAVVDLAAMRDAVNAEGKSPDSVNPLCHTDLVIDHSVIVDFYGNNAALEKNREKEMERNRERYRLLKWAQGSFDDMTVIPPGVGICHQVNLEQLAKVSWDKNNMLYPDTLVGTDSHTTMINGLGVLGWGVGGIEAEAVMLGQPVPMAVPEIIGVRLTGKLQQGVTATDLVLTVTEILRETNVVGKFVEYFGPGLASLSVADRATVANMSPEYGATCGIFPVDQKVLDYLAMTGRPGELIERVETYNRKQELFVDEANDDAVYTQVVEIDLDTVKPSIAGPKRPQDRVNTSDLTDTFLEILKEEGKSEPSSHNTKNHIHLSDGDLAIAAITSCTNTSNPTLMLIAGLIAKAATEKGLEIKPWVKTSFAPGSPIVKQYLDQADLSKYLDQLGFNIVGYGCTTCIGNSGPIHEELAEAVEQGKVSLSAVLSGNRNFEGRINPHVQYAWLASPPLVVIYALMGHMRGNITHDPVAYDKNDKPVFLADLWPDDDIVDKMLEIASNAQYEQGYDDVIAGDESWNMLDVPASTLYEWDDKSTYIQLPPFYNEVDTTKSSFEARILAILGDSVTTDHISPAGNIPKNSPAGKYLLENNVDAADFNSYGARRGNHQVMMRGTFANIRLKNQMAEGKLGGYTKRPGENEIESIFDAAMAWKKDNMPLVIFAGKEYGTGSSRDWAAKGTLLLGVKAVIAESFERIHRSNLVGMGVMPLQLPAGEDLDSLQLDGTEEVRIDWNPDWEIGQPVKIRITRKDGNLHEVETECRILTRQELAYFYAGGLLPYMAKKLAGKAD